MSIDTRALKVTIVVTILFIIVEEIFGLLIACMVQLVLLMMIWDSNN